MVFSLWKRHRKLHVFFHLWVNSVYTLLRSSQQSCFICESSHQKPATLLRMRPWQRCIPVGFVKFLRTPFLPSTSGRLLLYKFFNSCMTQVLIIKNQPTELQSKSLGWFLYDWELRHERIKNSAGKHLCQSLFFEKLLASGTPFWCRYWMSPQLDLNKIVRRKNKTRVLHIGL